MNRCVFKFELRLAQLNLLKFVVELWSEEHTKGCERSSRIRGVRGSSPYTNHLELSICIVMKGPVANNNQAPYILDEHDTPLL